jgi:polyhydroxybutyrate depolymerase
VVGSPANPVLVVSVADFCGAYPGACGTRHVRQVTVGGLLREYIVYEPWVTLGKSARPVVFMLHGTSGDGDKFLGISGWREKADSAGMVVVFPSALRHCFYEDDITVNGIFDADEIRAPTKWAFGGLGKASKMPLCTPDQLASLPAEARAAADHPLADDIAYFDAMVDDLKQTYAVDAKRLYVTGFSNGGQMAGRLAAERSTVLAAGASSAGPADPDIPTATRPMSYVATVGTVDDRFMAALGGQPLPLTDSGGNAAFINVMVKPFADVQRLDPTLYSFAPVALGQTDISLYAYSTSLAVPPAGNRLYVAVIEGLDHQYPNGKNHPVIMAEVLWPFFESQVLP